MQVRAEAVTMLATGKPEMPASLRSIRLAQPPAAVRGRAEKTEWHHSSTISRQVSIRDIDVVLCLPRQISAGHRRETSKPWPADGFRTRSRNVAASGGQFKSVATSSSEVIYKERRR